MPKKQYNMIALLVLCLPLTVYCQQNQTNSDSTRLPAQADTAVKRSYFTINAIFISGNHKTKSYIIERELPFRIGDSVYLPELVAKFQRSKELLTNTRLFTAVVVSLKGFHGYQVDVQIDVVERWYIFPVPYFRPVDRNLSAWADKNYSLARVNYGLKFLYNNFTGRNDRLRMWLITGYTKQLQLNYDQPYADKTLKHGYGFGILYAALKEINISTTNNQQTFLNTENSLHAGKYLFRQSGAFVNYFYRPALTTKHTLRLGLSRIQSDSAVLAFNPKYVSNAAPNIVYPEIAYTIEYQKADYVAYLLKGFMGDLNLTKRGFSSNMNLTQLTARFTSGWALGHHFYAGLQGYGVLKLPLEQPYFNQRLFGYGDTYLRGLEKYVIDGVAGGLLRTTLRKKLYSFSIGGGRIPSLERIPFAIYAKIFGDLGYAYNRTFTENSLVNKMLYTKGIGVDVVSSYDFVFRCEYSFNQLGKRGFFFHIRNDF